MKVLHLSESQAVNLYYEIQSLTRDEAGELQLGKLALDFRKDICQEFGYVWRPDVEKLVKPV